MRETLVTLFYARRRRRPLSIQSAASSGITLFEVRACFYPIFIRFFRMVVVPFSIRPLLAALNQVAL